MPNKTLVFVKLAYVSPLPQSTVLSLWYCLTWRGFGSLFGMKTHLQSSLGIRVDQYTIKGSLSAERYGNVRVSIVSGERGGRNRDSVIARNS